MSAPSEKTDFTTRPTNSFDRDGWIRYAQSLEKAANDFLHYVEEERMRVERPLSGEIWYAERDALRSALHGGKTHD